MWENIVTIFTGSDFWAILIKVLVTALLTGLLGLLGTLLGKIISRFKNSKIYKYAKTCVAAAEQKFPNEGKKMGPEKMQYVMDQLIIKFPKIRDNRYLYNVAEAAVFELNKEFQQQAAIEEFKEKYGEDPLAVKSQNNNEIESKDELDTKILDINTDTVESNSKISGEVNQDISDKKEDNTVSKESYTKLTSF